MPIKYDFKTIILYTSVTILLYIISMFIETPLPFLKYWTEINTYGRIPGFIGKTRFSRYELFRLSINFSNNTASKKKNE